MSKRFRKARWVAGTATVATAVFASAGGIPSERFQSFLDTIRYDPSVAVLSLTLIAVIWYTYFTYQAVHREPPVRLGLSVEFTEARAGALIVAWMNHTERPLQVSPELKIWRDDEAVELSDFWDAVEDRRFSLAAGEGVKAPIWLEDIRVRSRSSRGVQSIRKQVLVETSADWFSIFGDQGKVGPQHYHLDLRGDGPQFARLIDPKNIERVKAEMLGEA